MGRRHGSQANASVHARGVTSADVGATRRPFAPRGEAEKLPLQVQTHRRVAIVVEVVHVDV